MKERMLALLLSASIVFAGIAPVMPLEVRAGQTAGESIAAAGIAETSPSEITSGETTPSEVTPGEAQVEKELVQCSNDWTIFRCVNDGTPSFELYYMDKTLEELEEEGSFIQYQIIDTSSTSRVYTWKKFNSELSDELKDLSNDTSLIQFALSGNSVSSDAFSILPRDNPYILSATISTNPQFSTWEGLYNLGGYPNTFRLTLKINENLSGDNASVSMDAGGLDSYLIGSYSASNLSYENKVENYTVQGKNYTLKYSEVTFDVQVASEANASNNPYAPSSCFIVYHFNFDGLEGIESHNQPAEFSIGTRLPVVQNVSVESITINANKKIVIAGDKIGLSTTIAPSDATDKSVTWSSSNTDYATVDTNGVVIAKEDGIGKSVTITATANDGSGVTGTCTLTILEATDIPVEEIAINAPSPTVKPESKIVLSATVAPSDATDKSVTWNSSNTDYATVDENGVVTAKEAGVGKSVIITAEANDGSGVKGTYTIAIVEIVGEEADPEPISVTGITITAPSDSVTAGSKLVLSATAAPSDATDKSVTWTSSNTAYATVDANGVVTANAAGAGKNVTITAKANDGSGVSGTYTLYIEPIPVTGITIKGASTSVDAGDKLALSATAAPSNATDKSVTWTSSNTAYATVDANGVVTTKTAGAGKTVTITATANDGSGVNATFIINIKKVNVSKLTLTTTNKTVKAGQKATIKATVSPSNATNKALTWTSSNTKYATVNTKGVVTTKKAGVGKTVTITAKAKDGSGKKASIKIKIVKTVPVSSIKLTTSNKTVQAGKKVTVKATIAPSNASNKALTWTTSNKKYATVSSKGVVTTKKAGKGKTVTITAKAKDGSGKKATIKIRIK